LIQYYEKTTNPKLKGALAYTMVSSDEQPHTDRLVRLIEKEYDQAPLEYFCMILGNHMPHNHARVLTILDRLLAHPSHFVRARTVRSVVNMNAYPSDQMAYLNRIVVSADTALRESLAEKLHARESSLGSNYPLKERLYTQLIADLSPENEKVRSAAALALHPGPEYDLDATLKSVEAWKALTLKLLNDPSEKVQKAMIRGLIETKQETCAEFYKLIMESETVSPGVKDFARQELYPFTH
jgi:hypothetical protein